MWTSRSKTLLGNLYNFILTKGSYLRTWTSTKGDCPQQFQSVITFLKADSK